MQSLALNIHCANDLSYFFNRSHTCERFNIFFNGSHTCVLVDFIFNSAQAQLVILCATMLNIFSLLIKLYSCIDILSVLPIAQLVERQTVVLKVVGSNLAWQM